VLQDVSLSSRIATFYPPRLRASSFLRLPRWLLSSLVLASLEMSVLRRLSLPQPRPSIPRGSAPLFCRGPSLLPLFRSYSRAWFSQADQSRMPGGQRGCPWPFYKIYKWLLKPLLADLYGDWSRRVRSSVRDVVDSRTKHGRERTTNI
jgi:hypothetical protein